MADDDAHLVPLRSRDGVRRGHLRAQHEHLGVLSEKAQHEQLGVLSEEYPAAIPSSSPRLFQ